MPPISLWLRSYFKDFLEETLIILLTFSVETIALLPEEPILAMPYQFMAHLIQAVPTVVRPLKIIQKKKATDYLKLATILLNRFARNDTNGRAVAFLTDIVRNNNPGVLPDLPWFQRGSTRDIIDVSARTLFARVAPSVKFGATIR